MYIATQVGIYDHGVVAWDVDLEQLKKKIIKFQTTQDDYHYYSIDLLGDEDRPQYIGRYLKVAQTDVLPRQGWNHIGNSARYDNYTTAAWVFVWEQFPDHIEIPDENNDA